MSQASIKFRPFTGVRPGPRRNIGILLGNEELDTTGGIASLKPNQGKDLSSRIQHWLDGADSPKKYFHNFPDDPICPELFVFKVGDHRFYGYLCHPLAGNRALQVCVLCSHAKKNKWETDLAEKSLVKRWSLSNEALASVIDGLEDPEKNTRLKDGRGRREKPQ